MEKSAPRFKNCAPFFLLALAPLFAVLLGSAFNIWYNLTRIEPILTPDQNEKFYTGILWYNLIAYPVLIVLWLWLVFSLAKPYCDLRERLVGELDSNDMANLRKRLLNLPWYGIAICGAGWLACAPALSFALRFSGDPLASMIDFQIFVSILIAALITTTHAFYIVEILSQKYLYPVFFVNARPYETEGGLVLSLRGHGFLWTLSIGFCPIVSLLLIDFAGNGEQSFAFKGAVGGLGISFGLGSAYLLSKLVVDPIHRLRDASKAVAAGNLDTRVDLLRADEFGPLIDEFNNMVAEVKEKQRLQETFGPHVGREIAQQILERDPGLGGEIRVVSIMFCDIRNFTARSYVVGPEKIVGMLNLFFTDMLGIVEKERELPSTGEMVPGGILLQMLGDGFLALFGAGRQSEASAETAVRVGEEMLDQLVTLNRKIQASGHDPIEIGIGIHTGPAVVGSIGSPDRMQFSAIGDTTNVASRVEGLTKVVGVPLLFTKGTLERLPDSYQVTPLPPQMVKGQPEPVEIFTTWIEEEKIQAMMS